MMYNGMEFRVSKKYGMVGFDEETGMYVRFGKRLPKRPNDFRVLTGDSFKTNVMYIPELDRCLLQYDGQTYAEVKKRK